MVKGPRGPKQESSCHAGLSNTPDLQTGGAFDKTFKDCERSSSLSAWILPLSPPHLDFGVDIIAAGRNVNRNHCAGPM